MSVSKNTGMWIAGVIVFIALVAEVLSFGIGQLLPAIGVWFILLASALLVTPRRGPEDELWFFGVIREIAYRWRRRGGGGADRGKGGGESGPAPDGPPSAEPSAEEPVPGNRIWKHLANLERPSHGNGHSGEH
jgi:hypothetical protein